MVVLNCARTRKITICHDPIHHSGVKLIERILTTLYIKNSDEVIVLTKSFIPIVEKKFNLSPQHIHYMPHGRMSEYIIHSETLPMIKENAQNTCNFLFFGRIEKYKGLHILAKAYKQLSERYKNISLTIVGSGDFTEYEPAFKGLPHTTIINKYIADEDIGLYFSTPNTILVLPYLDASQSGVIPIALEYNVPIIASDTGGLKEQLNNGNIGFFCEANNADALEKQMEKCINHKEIIEEEKNKMKIFLRTLDWNIVTRNILTI